jgi:CO/xanthine dehydrogenase Mo-binding subunit
LPKDLKLKLEKTCELDVDTGISPPYWKTVASMTSFMAGRAVIKAADDAILQLKNYASILLRCPV